MLKWTVSKRPPNGEPVNHHLLLNNDQHGPKSRRSLGALRTVRSEQLRDNRRKSLGSSEVQRRFKRQNKENQIIATPHPLTQRHSGTSSTPFVTKAEFALRDVSNRTPTSDATVNSTTPLISRKRNLPLSPVAMAGRRHQQGVATITATSIPYASTLPTFDVEYSPSCGPLKSTAPMIALRGLTVQDSFFSNPCYFRDDAAAAATVAPPASKRLKFSPEITPLAKRLSELRFSKMSIKRASIRSMNNNNNVLANEDEDDDNMSSKALNDTELDKMIDEILESSRKIKPAAQKLLLQATRKRTASSMSSDECIVSTTCTSSERTLDACDTVIEVSPRRRRHRRQPSAAFAEREVRTPDSAAEEDTIGCHLRRQKGVRRKHLRRKNERDGGSSSPPAAPVDALTDEEFLRKNIELLASMNTPKDSYADMANAASIKKRCLTSGGSKSSYESTPGIETIDLQGSSTPTGQQQTIRRCLTFSPDSMEDSMDKRKSVASSTASTRSCSKGSAASAIISGILDLAITADENRIQIHGELV